MKQPFRAARQRGFTLVELMIGMGLFLIVVGASLALFSEETPLFRQQQNLTRLNLSLRNAATQFQLDVVNAGTGYFAGANVPNFPIGVTIVNNDPAANANCYDAATHTYGSTCFDALNVIATQSGVPLIHPTDIGTNCVSTTSSTLFGNPAPGDTAAQDAAFFKTGDQLLLIKADGSQMASVVLTKDGKASGAKIQLQHNPTGANGTNTSSNDPLGISTNPNNKLGITFCDTDWILKLSPVQYWVDASDQTNPRLMRSAGGSTDVLADQIIGFKVGATIWNGTADTDSATYNYVASSYAYDYTLVRSVRISLIGRTPPNNDPKFVFRNPFDNGPYQIQGISIVVNPRNLSMND
jgi:prepilin-type N-terminal cleavage/methylation domain-containing protein